MNPKFTVVTVSYNSESTIEQTILSVLNQSFKNFEYLIIDGGSSDSTVEIIKRYEGRFEGRLRWVSESDQGIYYAMNKGIDMSTGQYIGLLNSDDWYEPDALETVEKSIKGNEDVLYGMLNVWDDEKLKYVYANYVDKIPEESLAHPSSFISQECYSKFGKYTTEFRSTSDYEFFLRLYHAGCSFKFVNGILANFRCGGMSAGTLGYFETLQIRYKHGYISKQQYWKLVLIRKMKNLLSKVKQCLTK
ncbi:glycosyltransferase family 2 protein [Psychrobium sp. 1_MG-2023]|uniref:glycosyltransferase family 2 protein n=1 Tax=Psychrobium sp. 1_MG-2023 TaxID=3062624 RepID=UPI000C344FA6|nr:glycosyltransferase family 2 protein [Psychrobium sp. 1_MG-2023]MDP2562084.1 glycosyltransferase family 2 protein [Psychrobium sp. 1_MG-2023]PKF55683.1 glycosyltransferase [Alteromonadales bacterium alter-6D02]